MPDRKSPSLYEILTGNFTGDLPLEVVSEEDQVILSVLDNIQRILNARAGTLSHLPDYGLPDMTKILQGMPATAHELYDTLAGVLLKYEPRLQSLNVTLLEQQVPGSCATPSMRNGEVSGLYGMGPSLCQRVK